MVAANALVSLRGNRYSVPHGLVGGHVQVRSRHGTDTFSFSGDKTLLELVAHIPRPVTTRASGPGVSSRCSGLHPMPGAPRSEWPMAGVPCGRTLQQSWPEPGIA